MPEHSPAWGTLSPPAGFPATRSRPGQSGHDTATLDEMRCALDISIVERAYRAVAVTPLPEALDIMKRPPRPRRERLLNWGLLLRAYCFLGIMEAAIAMSAFFFVLHRSGWQYGQTLPHDNALYLQATAATLSAIVVAQIVNVFLCRSPSRSVFSTNPLSNRLLLAGIGLEVAIILVIDYTPWGWRLFGTAPIDVATWLYMLPFAGAMLVLEEGRKALLRKNNR